MSKIFSKPLIFVLLVFLFIPFAINAVDIINPITYNTTAELIGALVGFLMKIAIPIAVMMIVVAGFYFITAAGEPEKINTAKKIVLWTLIGLGIVLLARGFTEVIEMLFKEVK